MEDDLLGGRQVLRHAPVREQVASILRDAIVDLRLAPGQLLVERQLCEMTSASRPSVREALRQLEAEGLVESINGRGTRVSIASPQVAAHVYEVRADLEGLAADLFAQKASDSSVAELGAAVDELVQLARAEGDGGEAGQRAVLAAKNRVYDVLFLGAGNPVLHEMISALQRRVTQLRALTLAQPGRPRESAAEIEAIYRAIARRDSSAARDAATLHVRRAAAALAAVAETA